MKKKLWLLALLVSLLLFGYNNIQAAEIKANDVPTNTYVIGTHMFTEEVVLTTKHIMLGATTIESDKLSDMVIYYKNPRGTWIDGLSGETVETPTEFNIEYQDLEEFIETPILKNDTLELIMKETGCSGEDCIISLVDGKYLYDLRINKEDYRDSITNDKYSVT